MTTEKLTRRSKKYQHKPEALKEYYEGNKTIASICFKYKIAQSTLHRWVNEDVESI